MHHEVKEPALDKVCQKGFFMAVKERNPDILVLNLEEITLDADVPGLPASFLEEIMIPVIIPVNPFHLAFKSRKHRDYERRDEIPGMEKELFGFTIQESYRFFKIRDMIVGIPQYTDPQ
jgi:hypothetical protein